RKLCNDRAQINQTHWHPHEKATDLLVFVRSDTPLRLNQVQNARLISRRLCVDGTYAHRRERNENPEDAARHASAEKIKHRGRRRDSFVFARRKNLPPENRT